MMGAPPFDMYGPPQHPQLQPHLQQPPMMMMAMQTGYDGGPPLPMHDLHLHPQQQQQHGPAFDGGRGGRGYGGTGRGRGGRGRW